MALYIGLYAFAIIVHTRADKLLPAIDRAFDTLPIQRRHIEHMHEGVWFRKNIFNKNDSFENIDIFPLLGLINSYHIF